MQTCILLLIHAVLAINEQKKYILPPPVCQEKLQFAFFKSTCNFTENRTFPSFWAGKYSTGQNQLSGFKISKKNIQNVFLKFFLLCCFCENTALMNAISRQRRKYKTNTNKKIRTMLFGTLLPLSCKYRDNIHYTELQAFIFIIQRPHAFYKIMPIYQCVFPACSMIVCQHTHHFKMKMLPLHCWIVDQ